MAKTQVAMKVNGKAVEALVEPRTSAMDAPAGGFVKADTVGDLVI